MEKAITKTNNNNTEDDTQYTEHTLTMTISGFSAKPMIIKEAKSYNLKTKNNHEKQVFFNAITGNITDFNGDILVDDFSVKNSRFVKKYLKQNCLCLTENAYLDKNLTLKQNLQVISLIYSAFDLSNASISSFLMKEFANTEIKKLTKQQKNLAILSYTVCCPAIIWVIDNELLVNIDEEQKEIFNNALKIRTKHGGVAIIVS